MLKIFGKEQNHSNSIWSRKSTLLLKNKELGLDIAFENYLEINPDKKLVDEKTAWEEFLKSFYMDIPNNKNPHFLPLDIKFDSNNRNNKEEIISSELSVNSYFKTILDNLNEKINLFVGDSGSGKTTLMMGLMQKLLNDPFFEKSYLPIYLNFSSTHDDIYFSLNSSTKSIFYDLKLDIEKFKKISEKYLAHSAPLLFLFDTGIFTSGKTDIYNNNNDEKLIKLIKDLIEEINTNQNFSKHKLIIFHKGNLDYLNKSSSDKIYEFLKNYQIKTYELQKLNEKIANNYIKNISGDKSINILDKLEQKEIITTPIFLDFINSLSLGSIKINKSIETQSELYLIFLKYRLGKKFKILEEEEKKDNIITWIQFENDITYFDINNIKFNKTHLIEFYLQKIATNEINTLEKLKNDLENRLDFKHFKNYPKIEELKDNSKGILNTFIKNTIEQISNSIIKDSIITIKNDKIEFFHNSFKDFIIAYSIFFDEEKNFVDFKTKNHYEIKLNSFEDISISILSKIMNLAEYNQQEDFFEGLNLNTNNIYNKMGLLYKQKNDFEKAIKYYQKEIKINSNNSYPYEELYTLYSEKDNPKEKKYYYSKSKELKPNFSDYNYEKSELNINKSSFIENSTLINVDNKNKSEVNTNQQINNFIINNFSDTSNINPKIEYIKENNNNSSDFKEEIKEEEILTENRNKGFFSKINLKKYKNNIFSSSNILKLKQHLKVKLWKYSTFSLISIILLMIIFPFFTYTLSLSIFSKIEILFVKYNKTLFKFNNLNITKMLNNYNQESKKKFFEDKISFELISANPQIFTEKSTENFEYQILVTNKYENDIYFTFKESITSVNGETLLINSLNSSFRNNILEQLKKNYPSIFLSKEIQVSFKEDSTNPIKNPINFEYTGLNKNFTQKDEYIEIEAFNSKTITLKFDVMKILKSNNYFRDLEIKDFSFIVKIIPLIIGFKINNDITSISYMNTNVIKKEAENIQKIINPEILTGLLLESSYLDYRLNFKNTQINSKIIKCTSNYNKKITIFRSDNINNSFRFESTIDNVYASTELRGACIPGDDKCINEDYNICYFVPDPSPSPSSVYGNSNGTTYSSPSSIPSSSNSTSTPKNGMWDINKSTPSPVNSSNVANFTSNQNNKNSELAGSNVGTFGAAGSPSSNKNGGNFELNKNNHLSVGGNSDSKKSDFDGSNDGINEKKNETKKANYLEVGSK